MPHEVSPKKEEKQETEKTQEGPILVRRVSEAIGHKTAEDGKMVSTVYEAYYVGRRGGDSILVSGEEAPPEAREEALKNKMYDRRSTWVNSPQTKPEDVAKVYELLGASSPEELLRRAEEKKKAESEE